MNESFYCTNKTNQWVVIQKIYPKMHPVSCVKTHHDITDLVNREMVKNTKKLYILRTEHSFSKKIKYILKLCHRWHILRSSSFVAFKDELLYQFYLLNKSLLIKINTLFGKINSVLVIVLYHTVISVRQYCDANSFSSSICINNYKVRLLVFLDGIADSNSRRMLI